MAIGWSPKYEVEIGLADTPAEHFLLFAYEAAKSLNWKPYFVTASGFMASTAFSWKSYGESVTVTIDNGFAYIKSECNGSQFMDWGKNKKNIDAFLAAYDQQASAINEEELTGKLEALNLSFDKENENALMPGRKNSPGILSFFKPVDGYFFTPIIMATNIAIFILMVIFGVHILSPEGPQLIAWGANFKPRTLDGEWWRLLSSCFVHIGIMHLLLNMYALLYIGILLEPILGKQRFIAAYLVSGVAASVASLWWNDLTISAGASGAIFGMYGVFLALLTTNLVEKNTRKALLSSILVFVGYNLLAGLKANSGVDNAAHVGGLISGLVIGFAYVPSLKQHDNPKLKYSIIAALVVLLVIASSFVYRSIPNNIALYDKQMERFSNHEEIALGVYSLPEGTPDEVLLTQLQDKGINYWNMNIQLIDSLNKIDLPEPLIARNHKLKEYCQLRIQSYQYLHKGIKEHTDQYLEQVNAINLKLERMIKELSQ